MKRRLLPGAVCLMLILLLAVPVFATQTATMTVKASETTLQPGDTVTFTVSVSKADDCNVGGFKFEYDKQVFEYVSGKSLAGLKGFFAGVSTAADNLAGFFMNGVGTVEGDMFSVTMKVRADAGSGTYTVTGTPSLKSGDTLIDCTVTAASVTVMGLQTGTTQPQDTNQSGSEDISNMTQTTPASDTDPGEVSGTSPTYTAPTVEDTAGQAQKPEFPLWIIIAVAVVAVGGTVFLIVEIKRTRLSK